MIPIDPLTEVTASSSERISLGDYQHKDFFFSKKRQCRESESDRVWDDLYAQCAAKVQKNIQEFWEERGRIVEATLHPERTQAPEVSPFKVSARPAAPERWETENIETDDQRMEREAQEKLKKMKSSNIDALQTQEVTQANAAPARRGRPPKAAPATKPADVPLDLEHAAPNDPAQFQATDDDLPKAIGGTSETTPGPDLKAKHEEIRQQEAKKAAGPQLVPKQELGQWERITAVIEAMTKEGKRTPENVEKAVKDYFRAFLNVKSLPKPDDPAYLPAIQTIERLAQVNSALVMNDPSKAGLDAGVGYNALLRHVDKWPAEIKSVAMRLAILRYPDNCNDLLDFLHNVAKLGNLDNELLVFLRVFGKFNAAVAMALRTASTEQNKPMGTIIEGLDLNTATEGQILERISGVTSKHEPPADSGKTGELWSE